MVKVTDKDYYMEGYLKADLDRAKKKVYYDWDFVYVVDGKEGSGKSLLAQQVAYYLDPAFKIEQIAFTPDQFKKAVLAANKYGAVIFDEALSGLGSKASMSLVNRGITDMLAEIRQKNLFIIIVLPTYFDLDRYVAIWRSIGLLHVYTDENLNRGRYAVYDSEAKKYMYCAGKKFYDYSTGRVAYRGHFTNRYTVDEALYRKKKLDALRSKDSSDAFNKFQDQRDALFMVLEDKGYSHTQISDMMGKYATQTITKSAIAVAIRKKKAVLTESGDGVI